MSSMDVKIEIKPNKAFTFYKSYTAAASGRRWRPKLTLKVLWD